MARRRCINSEVLENDIFLDLSEKSKVLYIYLNLKSDDDGFVINPKTTMRMLGANNKDLSELIDNGFIISFDNGRLVVKHWWKHNTKQKDRYTPTQYQNELSQLKLDKNLKEYTLCYQNDNDMLTQDNLTKDNLTKDNLTKDNLTKDNPTKDKIIESKKNEQKRIVKEEKKNSLINEDDLYRANFNRK